MTDAGRAARERIRLQAVESTARLAGGPGSAEDRVDRIVGARVLGQMLQDFGTRELDAEVPVPLGGLGGGDRRQVDARGLDALTDEVGEGPAGAEPELQDAAGATEQGGAGSVTSAAPWTVTAHYYRDEPRPGEELSLIPDAVLSYVHTEARQCTLLTFFVEVDRTQMTIARLARKLYADAAYHAYTPQPQAAKSNRAPRGQATMPAWRSR